MFHRMTLVVCFVAGVAALSLLVCPPSVALTVLSEEEAAAVKGSACPYKWPCNVTYPASGLCQPRAGGECYLSENKYWKDVYLPNALACRNDEQPTCPYPNMAISDPDCSSAGQRPCLHHENYDFDQYCADANREKDFDTYTCKNSCG